MNYNFILYGQNDFIVHVKTCCRTVGNFTRVNGVHFIHYSVECAVHFSLVRAGGTKWGCPWMFICDLRGRRGGPVGATGVSLWVVAAIASLHTPFRCVWSVRAREPNCTSAPGRSSANIESSGQRAAAAPWCVGCPVVRWLPLWCEWLPLWCEWLPLWCCVAAPVVLCGCACGAGVAGVCRSAYLCCMRRRCGKGGGWL